MEIDTRSLRREPSVARAALLDVHDKPLCQRHRYGGVGRRMQLHPGRRQELLSRALGRGTLGTLLARELQRGARHRHSLPQEPIMEAEHLTSGASISRQNVASFEREHWIDDEAASERRGCLCIDLEIEARFARRRQQRCVRVSAVIGPRRKGASGPRRLL